MTQLGKLLSMGLATAIGVFVGLMMFIVTMVVIDYVWLIIW